MKAVPKLKAIFFDFDFTLVDASPGIITCVNHALQLMGRSEHPDDSIRRTIGLTLPDTFTRITGCTEDAERNRFKELYIERAHEVMASMTSLLPGVREGLHALRRRGYQLGIVSTKIRRSIVRTLEKESLSSAFEVIVGGDEVAQAKPHPEGILRALQIIGVAADNCLYVGDAVMDVCAAAAAGTSFLGVLTGTTSREELESAGARCTVERFDHNILQHTVRP